VLLQAGLLLGYYLLRALGQRDLGYVDAAGYVLPWLFLPTVVLLPAALCRRSRVLLGVATTITVLFVANYGLLYLPRLPVRSTHPTFTVMTYNVFRWNERVDRCLAEIARHDPDILSLHELEGPMAQSLVQRLSDRYPHFRLEPGRGLFSRYPIVEYEAFRLGPGRAHWAQQAVLEADGRRVTVLNVHARYPPLLGLHPWGLPLGIPVRFANEERDADVRALISRLNRLDGPLIVVGDLNLTDQQAMYPALTEVLHDAHRESGWGMGFTYARYPRIGLALWRIDYILHSPDLVALRTVVGKYGGSDHRPVIAQLAFRMREG
jgi:endonuclease/exonuclease/phosphatase (EEP) superfamily protein YafD